MILLLLLILIILIILLLIMILIVMIDDPDFAEEELRLTFPVRDGILLPPFRCKAS